MHYVILVLSGGGAKGPFEVGALQTLEEKANKMTADLVDAIVATSIGAVNGSILATKVLTAEKLAKLMTDSLPLIFKKKFLRMPIYDKNSYAILYKKYVEDVLNYRVKMKDVDANTHFIVTATNMCDGLNHFFKSDKEDEGEMDVVNATFASFAAPLYFGQIDDPKHKAVWLDGGCGIENLPLWQAYVEAWKRGWFDSGNSTHILSIGTGIPKFWLDYNECVKGGILQQTIRAVQYFNSITKGSLARNQSSAVQIRTMKALEQYQPNFSFQHIDWPGIMPDKLDKMDNVDARYEYYEMGKKVGQQIELEAFNRTFKNL